MNKNRQARTELGLGDIISKVRRELIGAHKKLQRSGSPILFRVRSVTVQINFTIREDESTTGGLDFKLVALKQDDSVSREKVHSVRIELEGYESASFGLLQNEIEP